MDILKPEEIAEVIAEARVAHIGVISEGEPYVTPISYVALGDGIAFRSLAGKRLDAISVNPRVSVEISLHEPEIGSWRSVVASGNATVIEDTYHEAEMIQKLMNRYAESFDSLLGDTGPTLSKATVVRIEFDAIAGRSSGSHLAPHTRPGRL